MDKEVFLEIQSEKMSLADRINEIMERLTTVGNMVFQDLFDGLADRRMIIYTFLAVLELMKLRMIKAYQSAPFGVIRIFPAVQEDLVEELH